ncbi:MAG: SMC-Scp complex subunit ScpB [Hyphomicrobiaceae bacterium]|nr:SMC-Scp complex subunit ScpB [Hyphomicrobiaceae bacterium]
MGPPRLTLVPKNTDLDTEAGRDDALLAPSLTPESAAAGAGGDVASVEAAGRDGDDPVAMLAAQDRREKLRIIEALLFAAKEPLGETDITSSLVDGADVAGLLAELQADYAGRGINLVRVAGKWAFRTADDLSFILQRFAHEQRRLSKAALETLSIIAYHQPVTRAEIEEIRGVTTSAGTIDFLLETGWIRPRGRRRAPGRPVTYGTTETFLAHFGLDTVRDLPGLSELKGAGLLDSSLPPGFTMPEPRDVADLMPDELPLDEHEDDAQGALSFEEEALHDEGDSGEDGEKSVPHASSDPDEPDGTGEDEIQDISATPPSSDRDIDTI